MKCPKCSGPTSVTDSRPTEDSIRRRRRCDICGERFTTYEHMTEPSETDHVKSKLFAIQAILVDAANKLAKIIDPTFTNENTENEDGQRS